MKHEIKVLTLLRNALCEEICDEDLCKGIYCGDCPLENSEGVTLKQIQEAQQKYNIDIVIDK